MAVQHNCETLLQHLYSNIIKDAAIISFPSVALYSLDGTLGIFKMGLGDALDPLKMLVGVVTVAEGNWHCGFVPTDIKL
jgi:hypothetical protein